MSENAPQDNGEDFPRAAEPAPASPGRAPRTDVDVRGCYRGERTRWYRLSTIVLWWLCVVILLTAIALVVARDGPRSWRAATRVPFDGMYAASLLLAVMAECSVAAWFFAIGACWGSFLNVVVYRLPRRATLLGTSHCPACGHAIRVHDNVPILGWSWLRGRCRDCRTPISTRYPRVELLLGLVTLVLAVVDLGGPRGGAGAVLSLRQSGLVAAFLDPDGAAWCHFLRHVCLVWTMIAAGLMRGDAVRVPPGLLVVTTAIQVLLLLLEPFVRSSSELGGGGLVEATWGGSVGLVSGVLFSSAFRRSGEHVGRSVFVWLSLLVGCEAGPWLAAFLPATATYLGCSHATAGGAGKEDAPYLGYLNWLTLMGLVGRGIARWIHDST